MKSLILFLLLSFTLILPVHAKLALDLSSGLAYDSNVFQLSPYDIDRYNDGEPTLAYIKSADDLIWGTSLRLQYQYNLNQFRIRPYVKVAANRFMSNVDKSNENVLADVTILHKKGTLNLSYGYYPDNYLRKYKDKDGTGMYEKFTYDKNMYKADASLNIAKHEALYLYLKYDQYYYNKYFTEYNGNATTGGIGWRHSNPQFSFDGTYYYRKLVGESDVDQYADVADAAYDSNIYSFGMTWKNWKPVIGSNPINIRPSVSLSLEDRYYQGTDSFHSGRKDSVVDLGAGLLIPLQKNLDISLDFSHTMRNVSSDILSVPRYKEYTEDSISVGFRYAINLM